METSARNRGSNSQTLAITNTRSRRHRNHPLPFFLVLCAGLAGILGSEPSPDEGELFSEISGDIDDITAWTVNTGAEICSSPAIGHDETVYVESGAILHAYNPDGTLKWSYKAMPGTSASTCSTPAVADNDTIYFEDENRNLAAINPDGSLKWSYDLGPNYAIRAPAIARDGTVYVTSAHTSTLLAIDPDSGQFDWSRDLGGNRLTTPVVACDGSIYVGSEDALHALDSTGQVTWSSAAGQIRTPPVIGSDGTIYVGTATGDLELFSPDGESLGGYGIGEIRRGHTDPAGNLRQVRGRNNLFGKRRKLLYFQDTAQRSRRLSIQIGLSAFFASGKW